MSSADTMLEEGLRRLDLSTDDVVLEVFRVYQAELSLWKIRGFVGDAEEDIVFRHLLDCAAGAKYISDTHATSVADLGSGAGFPGVVLAALLPDIEVTLIESSSNRSSFLHNLCAVTGLKNVSIENTRIESVHQTFDLITWRAFKRLSDIEETAVSLLNLNGRMCAYKGRRSAIEQELGDSRYPWSQVVIHPLVVPFLDAERHLLILKP